ncbi:MAG: hypothetical protein JWR38_4323 [Mucilaginibacter sp.]|nr:hypothetical protein [Mucilaginibacter sp.]
MRILTVFLMFLFNTSIVLAQSDSVNFKRAEQETKRIAPGIKLRQVCFRGKSLFKSNQFISILEIKPWRKNKLNIAYEAKIKRVTDDFGIQNQALAAINGTFFDVKNGGSVDFIRVGGQIINENRLEKNNTRAGHQRAALVMKDGELRINGWDGSSDWEQKLDGQDVMLTGPLLLHNDQQVKIDSNSFSVTRHPRSAIAITDNNRILMITVDGRDANSAGMSLFELSKILHWLHCKDGVNLDGGGSTTLWVKNKGVVNYPSDNGKWDHQGERKVANVILVKRN